MCQGESQMNYMELKPLKKGEVAVTVTYRITDELINEKIPFLRANSRLKAYEGIPAIYIPKGRHTKGTVLLVCLICYL